MNYKIFFGIVLILFFIGSFLMIDKNTSSSANSVDRSNIWIIGIIIQISSIALLFGLGLYWLKKQTKGIIIGG